MATRRCRIAVIYNEPKHTPLAEHWLSHSAIATSRESGEFRDSSEYGVVEQMRSIAYALESDDNEVLIFSADDDILRLADFLSSEHPDVIFNCCESILGKSALEMNVAALYELFGIPYTGSAPLTLGLALNKALAKDLLSANGISTPKHSLLRLGEPVAIPSVLAYPMIIKPVSEDASIGIDDNSIVNNAEELRARVQFVHREFAQDALAEEYIDGRELNVAIMGLPGGGLSALPISEITFDTLPEGAAHIVSYEAKWVEESPLYRKTIPVCPADLEAATAASAAELALMTSRVMGIRDYGRIDLRLRKSDGKLFVLEANPNPDISEDAGFVRAARTSGRTFAGTINEILWLALERRRSAPR